MAYFDPFDGFNRKGTKQKKARQSYRSTIIIRIALYSERLQH